MMERLAFSQWAWNGLGEALKFSLNLVPLYIEIIRHEGRLYRLHSPCQCDRGIVNQSSTILIGRMVDPWPSLSQPD